MKIPLLTFSLLLIFSFPNVFLDASCSDDDFYNDDMDSVKDTTDKKMFYCGTSYEDAANCGAYCGITGLDSECGVGETW